MPFLVQRGRGERKYGAREEREELFYEKVRRAKALKGFDRANRLDQDPCQ